MNRFLKSAASGAIFAIAAFATAAIALQISGRNTDRYRSIDQVGIGAYSTDLNVTATPSGTQVTSYQITAGMTYVTTSTVGPDGVKLPSTTSFFPPTNIDAALNVIIINGTANAINLFPFAATDIMNANGVASGAGAATSLAAGKYADCWSVSVGKWYCSTG